MCSTGLILLAFVTSGAAQNSPRNVLILHTFSATAAPFEAIASAFQSTLAREAREPVEIYETALDTDRFSGQDMDLAHVELLQKRFAERHLDLIVPIGSPAAQFVANYRERAFPGIPAVFVGTDPRIIGSEALLRNATGVRQPNRVTDMVEDILQLLPDTTNVVVVLGDSPLERFWADVERREYEIYKNRLSFAYLNDLSLDQMEKRVSSLPPHSFIQLGLMIRDFAGITYDGHEPLRRLHAVANAPIVGFFQSQMGHGIIGGRLIQDQTIGVEAAHMAARILRGEPASSIPEEVLPTANPVYDWRELKRWGISESLLPAGSRILFREPTFWERYRWYVAAIVSVCLIEALLIAGLLTNLVRRRRVEQSLRQSEQKYTRLYESMMDAFVSVDMNGRLREFNPAYQQLLGYSSEELRQLSYTDITPERWHELEAEIIRDQVLGRGHSDVYEKEYRRKDRTVFPVELHTFLIRDEAGQPAAMWAIVRDITARKRAEAALRASEERFRQVAETVSDFIWEVDAEGLYRYTSPSVERILGYTPDELVGKVHFYDLFAPDVREQLKAAAFQTFATRQRIQTFLNPNISKSGRIVHLETSGEPVLDERGILLGYRGADTDVTVQYQAEIETQLLRQELSLYSRAATVNELTASIAHELNQPLAAILSNAQAALNLVDNGTAEPEELREIFSDIIADDQRAAEVIRNLRSMLKKGASEQQQLQINDLIRDVVSIVRNEALTRKVSIALDFGQGLPPVTGNRVQLQQVVLNLIVNAFDAMSSSAPPRSLTLRTREADGELILDVVDSGTGIPVDKLDKIFEPFVTTKAEGLGMGLSLCRSIVMSHLGRLWAENNTAGGATFHLVLPAEGASPHETTGEDHGVSTPATAPRPSGIVVLIVDDRQPFRRAVASVLGDLAGLRLIDEAADGAEALRKVTELKPDLVLLDVGIPGVNGIEAACRMRTVSPGSKILFLTQHDSPDFVSAALRTGALGYVLKVDVGSELLPAAEAVLRGEQYISAGIRRHDTADVRGPRS